MNVDSVMCVTNSHNASNHVSFSLETSVSYLFISASYFLWSKFTFNRPNPTEGGDAPFNSIPYMFPLVLLVSFKCVHDMSLPQRNETKRSKSNKQTGDIPSAFNPLSMRSSESPKQSMMGFSV